MTYLFTSKGMAELNTFVEAATLFAFDLDGTLAPIVDDPAGIAIQDEVRQCLIQLNDITSVAVITGRSRADAMTHLGFMPRFLVGNHGAEGLPGEETAGQDFTGLCQEWKSQLESILPDMPARGIMLEAKGESIALHYRQAIDKIKAQVSILAAIACLTPPPRVVSGIYVENIAPQNAPDKGEALEALMAHMGCSRAVFVGDDVTDEDVFRLRNPAILGVRVGKNLKSTAGYYLQGQHEVDLLLREIISLLKRAYKRAS